MTTPTFPDGLLEQLRTHLGPENVTAEAGQLEAVSRTCIPYQEIPRSRCIRPVSSRCRR